MNKLTLDIEELAVVSFETTPALREKGTVHANAWSDDSVCPHTPTTARCPI